MELELKHLVGYLPYGLKVIWNNVPHEAELITLMYGYNQCDLKWEFGQERKIVSDIKPILYPLSFLTKEITVNGETFLPLVELSKLVHSKSNLKDFTTFSNQTYNGVNCDWGIRFETKMLYYSEIKSFCLYANGIQLQLWNQLELFNKLFEWHFDLFNLIPQGLAIDTSTLK